MRIRSKAGSIVFAVAVVMTNGCPPNTVKKAAMPASITVPRDSAGRVDVSKLDELLEPYIVTIPHTEDRHCKSPTSGCVVKVKIQEIGQSNDVNPKVGPGSYRIIGTMTNTSSTDVERDYDLQPRTKYYVWINNASPSSTVSSSTQWGFIDAAGVSSTIGYVIKCDEDKHLLPGSRLGFKDCAGSPSRQSALSQRTSAAERIAPVFRLASFGTSAQVSIAYAVGETWFECDPGCCTGTRVLQ